MFSPSTPKHIPLKQYRILRCEGEDASSFLQGQITADIRAVTPFMASLSACLNLKGRAISSFLVLEKDENIYDLLLHEDVSKKTLESLHKYAVFSKVSLSLLADDIMDVVGIIGEEPKEAGLLSALQFTLHQDTYSVARTEETLLIRLPSQSPISRYLWIGPTSASPELERTLTQQGFEQCSLSTWRAYQAHSGEAHIEGELSEKLIPNVLNYHELKGISYDKGCYRGQEIVARLHYRGDAKETAKLFQTDWGEPEPPGAGDAILDGSGKPIGQVLVAGTINTGVGLIKLFCLALVKKAFEMESETVYIGKRRLLGLHMLKILYTK